MDKPTGWVSYRCSMAARITFVRRADQRSPRRFASGYRNSSVHFPFTEPIGCLADFTLRGRDVLEFGESGEATLSALLHSSSALDDTIPVEEGDVFYAIESGLLILTGRVLAVHSFERVFRPPSLVS